MMRTKVRVNWTHHGSTLIRYGFLVIVCFSCKLQSPESRSVGILSSVLLIFFVEGKLFCWVNTEKSLNRVVLIGWNVKGKDTAPTQQNKRFGRNDDDGVYNIKSSLQMQDEKWMQYLFSHETVRLLEIGESRILDQKEIILQGNQRNERKRQQLTGCVSKVIIVKNSTQYSEQNHNQLITFRRVQLSITILTETKTPFYLWDIFDIYRHSYKDHNESTNVEPIDLHH